MADNYGFTLEKQRAVERMRELNARAKYRQSASPLQSENKKQYTDSNCKNENFLSSLFSGLNLPLLGDIGKDSDIIIILGIMLILGTENSDKLLLLALLYILL